MLGHNRCLYCKTENPYACATIAFEHGWSKLTVRNSYVAKQYKYQGLICLDCLKSDIMPMFYGDGSNG